MVVPDCDPVRIGDGPTVATRFEDRYSMEIIEVWVNGVKRAMATPWPDPQPVPNSPYEAFVHGDWPTDRFAIRLRQDQTPQEER
jgi:hypothetical protein